MRQRLEEVLSLNFACDDSITEGNVVEITNDLTIGVPTIAGSLRVIGTVVRKQGYLESNASNAWPQFTPNGVSGGNPAECTVETRFRERRSDRVSGSALPVGPIVFGVGGVVLPYTAAGPAVVIGTTTGTQTFIDSGGSQNNLIGISVSGGATQTFTIPAGSQTMAQVAQIINATASGFIASVNTAGNLVLTTLSDKDNIAIMTQATNAYTLLGLTVGVTSDKASDYDPAAIMGIAITSCSSPGIIIQTLEF
jgi:hypothetical protein